MKNDTYLKENYNIPKDFSKMIIEEFSEIQLKFNNFTISYSS